MNKVDADWVDKFGEKHGLVPSEIKEDIGTSCGSLYVYGVKKILSFDEPIDILSKHGAQSFLNTVEFAKTSHDKYPSAGATCRYILQAHFVGSGVHYDLRFDIGKEMIGWTLVPALVGKLKQPVRTSGEAEKAMVSARWAWDISSGMISGGSKLRAIKKQPMETPHTFTDAGEFVSFWETSFSYIVDECGVDVSFSDDRDERAGSIFKKIDSGVVEFLAQKGTMHEYWLCDGTIKPGRYMFIAVNKYSGDEDFEETDQTVWMFLRPNDQVPYVLGKRAIETGWLPPRGVSALPKEISALVKDNDKYWEMDGNSAKEARERVALTVRT